ncbi:MAG: N-acetyltransferase [Deltaproteobacteria bacterium]|nr:N-acetyltransferase [Deltaproteobacteria bacterium]
MKLIIRHETESEHRTVEELTRDAFWNLYFPGCDEHYLVHILRDHPDYLPELSFVAELDGEVVGMIMYTRSWLIDENNCKKEIVSFGPLCVHPAHQRKGIGRALLNHSANILRRKNIAGITILGDPHNYVPYGFKNGIDCNISDMDGNYPLGLLVLPLAENAFENKAWKCKQSDVFAFKPELVRPFDETFPPKEKKHQPSQDLFMIMVRAILRTPE